MAEYQLRRRVFRRDSPRHEAGQTVTLQDVATVAFLADASIEVVAMEERAPGDWVVFVPCCAVDEVRRGFRLMLPLGPRFEVVGDEDVSRFESDPEFERQMAMARRVMERYRTALAILAKS